MTTTLEKNPPNTILLSDRAKVTIINDLPIVDTSPLPGHLVEMFNDTSVASRLAWRKSSQAAGQVSMFVLLEQDILNIGLVVSTQYPGLTTPYISGDDAIVASLHVGTKFLAWINSGQNITLGDYLGSNGDGTLKEASASTATANVAKFQSLETTGAVTVPTHVMVRRIQ